MYIMYRIIYVYLYFATTNNLKPLSFVASDWGSLFIIMKNIPYRKQYDKNGVLLNPITKENPYLNKVDIYLKKVFDRRKSSNLKIWERNANKFFKGKIAVGI